MSAARSRQVRTLPGLILLVPLLYAQTVATYATYGADRRAAAAMPRRAARRTDLKGLPATDRRYRRLQPSGHRRETRQNRTLDSRHESAPLSTRHWLSRYGTFRPAQAEIALVKVSDVGDALCFY